MPRKRWTEEQIIYAVKQSEAGKKAVEICRELGVSDVLHVEASVSRPGGARVAGAPATAGGKP